jgi:hypothetical protein
VKVFAPHWATLFQSSAGYWLEIVGERADYPLLPLWPNVATKLAAATPAQVDVAFSRLVIVDYKTVSVVAFEEYLRTA